MFLIVATEGGGRSAGKGLEQEATSRVPWESKTHVGEAPASARRVRKRWDFSFLEERLPRGRGPERDRRRDRFSNPSECKKRKTKMRHAKSQAELQPANKTWKEKKKKKSGRKSIQKNTDWLTLMHVHALQIIRWLFYYLTFLFACLFLFSKKAGTGQKEEFMNQNFLFQRLSLSLLDIILLLLPHSPSRPRKLRCVFTARAAASER